MGKREGHLELVDTGWSLYDEDLEGWLFDWFEGGCNSELHYRWVEDGVSVLLPRYDEV